MDDTLELALVDPSNTKSSKMTNKTLNFQMLKHNLESITKRGMNSVIFGTNMIVICVKN